MKQTIIVLTIFGLGFLTHAFFFPDILSNGITDVKDVIIPVQKTSADHNNQQIPLITEITFDGKKFSRHNVTIGFTRYIQITNTSDSQQMWLISDLPELTTSRGYGASEAVKTQFNKKGQFVVADKNNPAEKLVITVK